MFIPRRAVLSLLVCLLGAASLVFALGASGGSRDHGDSGPLFRSTLAPSDPTDPAFHGIKPGGVPWVLRRGDVRLNVDGEIRVKVRGLIIPALGTADGVTSISASLLCGADAQAGPTATTPTEPLSAAGNGEIEATLTLPATCLAPIVVVHPGANTTRWIAVTGWKR